MPIKLPATLRDCPAWQRRASTQDTAYEVINLLKLIFTTNVSFPDTLVTDLQRTHFIRPIYV
jgi:hypothetical protein